MFTSTVVESSGQGSTLGLYFIPQITLLDTCIVLLLCRALPGREPAPDPESAVRSEALGGILACQCSAFVPLSVSYIQ